VPHPCCACCRAQQGGITIRSAFAAPGVLRSSTTVKAPAFRPRNQGPKRMRLEPRALHHSITDGSILIEFDMPMTHRNSFRVRCTWGAAKQHDGKSRGLQAGESGAKRIGLSRGLCRTTCLWRERDPGPLLLQKTPHWPVGTAPEPFHDSLHPEPPAPRLPYAPGPHRLCPPVPG